MIDAARIARNIIAYKRALALAHCPDGWQTRAEYDDIHAALHGRLHILDCAHLGNGRPPKYLTQEERRAAELASKRRTYARRMAKGA